MEQNTIVTLDELKKGEEGVIIQLHGGYKFQQKLDSLGLRKGKKVTKISNIMMNGPVTIQVNNSNKIAIGRGMARKIRVRVN